jgi:predicted nuclease with RNAse H fold
MTGPYFGLDLTGSARPSGYAVLDASARLDDVGLVATDADIITLVERSGATTVAIDAPLGLPAGLCCLEASCPCAPWATPGIRASELAVRARGYGLYHTTKRSIIRTMVYRGIALRRTFEARDLRVLEVYPYATKAALFGRPIPKKTTPEGRRWLRERLATRVANLDGLARPLNHDELDAIAAAYTAVLLDRGEAEPLGDPTEGAIVVPTTKRYDVVTPLHNVERGRG